MIVPSTRILTPTSGIPALSTTVPVTVVVCAIALVNIMPMIKIREHLTRSLNRKTAFFCLSFRIVLRKLVLFIHRMNHSINKYDFLNVKRGDVYIRL